MLTKLWNIFKPWPNFSKIFTKEVLNDLIGMGVTVIGCLILVEFSLFFIKVLFEFSNNHFGSNLLIDIVLAAILVYMAMIVYRLINLWVKKVAIPFTLWVEKGSSKKE